MGGMSAQIPIKGDAKANQIAMDKVRADKLREVTAGHDGTWIAHPLINQIALQVFDENMLGPNQVNNFFSRSLSFFFSLNARPLYFQYHVLREDVKVTAADLLNTKVPGTITEQGIRDNANAAIAYTAAWVGGNGCIPLNHLMEDAATAEIARVQLWQWVKYQYRSNSGQPITVEYVDHIIKELAPGISKLAPGVKDEHVKVAVEYLKGQIRQQWPSEFLTSDLMVYLAAADGVEPEWQRASL